MMGFGAPFFHLPFCRATLIRSVSSTPFNAKCFTEGFHETSFLHFTMESQSASGSMISSFVFIFLMWRVPDFRISSYRPLGLPRRHVVVRLSAGTSVPCGLLSGRLSLRESLFARHYTIGKKRLLQLALLLLTLPLELTFHVLFASPRYAERNRTF